MRVETASEAKSGRIHHRNNAPRAGSRLRMVWDFYQSNRAKVVSLADLDPVYFTRNTGRSGTYIAQLRDYYGLDLRNVPGKGAILLGEWFGTKYRDYVNEAIDAELAKNPTPAKQANPEIL